ncbi:MAG: hypothetical protein ACHQRJ_10720 [Alphaproteobacteria bacterium]
MGRLGEIGGRRRGRVRSGRALALALLLGLLAPAPPAVAENGQWDYYGRTRPLPYYWVKWSADDGVCRRIVKALNGAGPSPASLYGDPVFLRWRDYADWPQDGPLSMFPTLGKWMEMPFFNDGKPVIAFKLAYPGSYDAGEDFYVFDDLEYYSSPKWRGDKIWNDPRILQPLKPFLQKGFGELVLLPKTMKNYEFWTKFGIMGSEEFNLAKLNEKIYVVARMPSHELFFVLIFSEDRKGHPVCIIGPKKPVRYK